MTIPAPNGLDGIKGSPAWVACHAKVLEAEASEQRADEVMALLDDRIEKRRAMLADQAEGGY